MKKFFIPMACVMLMATSCRTSYKTAAMRNVKAPLVSSTTAELEVSNKKIVYTYIPSASVRRGGFQNCINTAVREALAANGNGDVLVETQNAVIERKGLIGGRKIKSVTVTGFPAFYKNFKSVDAQILRKAIENNGIPAEAATVQERSGFKLFGR
ncbi:hypothetical protein [Bacteroides acidifaciens]|uniref:hypothetical protein n=1 Tax=Bacteroides acidifaciens TaxID=85831 RepID=UPI00258D8598|nr:hypothetical protein [Bacteroides acidifaciens]